MSKPRVGPIPRIASSPDNQAPSSLPKAKGWLGRQRLYLKYGRSTVPADSVKSAACHIKLGPSVACCNQTPPCLRAGRRGLIHATIHATVSLGGHLLTGEGSKYQAKGSRRMITISPRAGRGGSTLHSVKCNGQAS